MEKSIAFVQDKSLGSDRSVRANGNQKKQAFVEECFLLLAYRKLQLCVRTAERYHSLYVQIDSLEDKSHFLVLKNPPN